MRNASHVYCGGVTCACTCPKRRNISIAIQDTCTLSSLVNKCITICTPSIHLIISHVTPLHIWCATQGRLKTPRVATISWFADKSACCCRYCHCFYRLSCCIASYAIAIALFLYTSSLHTSIQFSIRFSVRFYG